MGRGKQTEWARRDKKSDPFARQKTAQQMNIDNFLVSSGWCTRFMKRNKLVLKLALELSKYRYRGYLFVFKIYCSNFILEFQIICLFYLTDEN